MTSARRPLRMASEDSSSGEADASPVMRVYQETARVEALGDGLSPAHGGASLVTPVHAVLRLQPSRAHERKHAARAKRPLSCFPLLRKLLPRVRSKPCSRSDDSDGSTSSGASSSDRCNTSTSCLRLPCAQGPRRGGPRRDSTRSGRSGSSSEGSCLDGRAALDPHGSPAPRRASPRHWSVEALSYEAGELLGCPTHAEYLALLQHLLATDLGLLHALKAAIRAARSGRLYETTCVLSECVAHPSGLYGGQQQASCPWQWLPYVQVQTCLLPVAVGSQHGPDGAALPRGGSGAATCPGIRITHSSAAPEARSALLDGSPAAAQQRTLGLVKALVADSSQAVVTVLDYATGAVVYQNPTALQYMGPAPPPEAIAALTAGLPGGGVQPPAQRGPLEAGREGGRAAGAGDEGSEAQEPVRIPLVLQELLRHEPGALERLHACLEAGEEFEETVQVPPSLQPVMEAFTAAFRGAAGRGDASAHAAAAAAGAARAASHESDLFSNTSQLLLLQMGDRALDAAPAASAGAQTLTGQQPRPQLPSPGASTAGLSPALMMISRMSSQSQPSSRLCSGTSRLGRMARAEDAPLAAAGLPPATPAKASRHQPHDPSAPVSAAAAVDVTVQGMEITPSSTPTSPTGAPAPSRPEGLAVITTPAGTAESPFVAPAPPSGPTPPCSAQPQHHPHPGQPPRPAPFGRLSNPGSSVASRLAHATSAAEPACTTVSPFTAEACSHAALPASPPSARSPGASAFGSLTRRLSRFLQRASTDMGSGPHGSPTSPPGSAGLGAFARWQARTGRVSLGQRSSNPGGARGAALAAAGSTDAEAACTAAAAAGAAGGAAAAPPQSLSIAAGVGAFVSGWRTSANGYSAAASPSKGGRPQCASPPTPMAVDPAHPGEAAATRGSAQQCQRAALALIGSTRLGKSVSSGGVHDGWRARRAPQRPECTSPVDKDGLAAEDAGPQQDRSSAGPALALPLPAPMHRRTSQGLVPAPLAAPSPRRSMGGLMPYESAPVGAGARRSLTGYPDRPTGGRTSGGLPISSGMGRRVGAASPRNANNSILVVPRKATPLLPPVGRAAGAGDVGFASGCNVLGAGTGGQRSASGGMAAAWHGLSAQHAQQQQEGSLGAVGQRFKGGLLSAAGGSMEVDPRSDSILQAIQSLPDRSHIFAPNQRRALRHVLAGVGGNAGGAAPPYPSAASMAAQSASPELRPGSVYTPMRGAGAGSGTTAACTPLAGGEHTPVGARSQRTSAGTIMEHPRSSAEMHGDELHEDHEDVFPYSARGPGSARAPAMGELSDLAASPYALRIDSITALRRVRTARRPVRRTASHLDGSAASSPVPVPDRNSFGRSPRTDGRASCGERASTETAASADMYVRVVEHAELKAAAPPGGGGGGGARGAHLSAPGGAAGGAADAEVNTGAGAGARAAAAATMGVELTWSSVGTPTGARLVSQRHESPALGLMSAAGDDAIDAAVAASAATAIREQEQESINFAPYLTLDAGSITPTPQPLSPLTAPAALPGPATGLAAAQAEPSAGEGAVPAARAASAAAPSAAAASLRPASRARPHRGGGSNPLPKLPELPTGADGADTDGEGGVSASPFSMPYVPWSAAAPVRPSSSQACIAPRGVSLGAWGATGGGASGGGAVGSGGASGSAASGRRARRTSIGTLSAEVSVHSLMVGFEVLRADVSSNSSVHASSDAAAAAAAAGAPPGRRASRPSTGAGGASGGAAGAGSARPPSAASAGAASASASGEVGGGGRVAQPSLLSLRLRAGNSGCCSSSTTAPTTPVVGAGMGTDAPGAAASQCLLDAASALDNGAGGSATAALLIKRANTGGDPDSGFPSGSRTDATLTLPALRTEGVGASAAPLSPSTTGIVAAAAAAAAPDTPIPSTIIDSNFSMEPAEGPFSPTGTFAGTLHPLDRLAPWVPVLDGDGAGVVHPTPECSVLLLSSHEPRSVGQGAGLREGSPAAPTAEAAAAATDAATAAARGPAGGNTAFAAAGHDAGESGSAAGAAAAESLSCSAQAPSRVGRGEGGGDAGSPSPDDVLSLTSSGCCRASLDPGAAAVQAEAQPGWLAARGGVAAAAPPLPPDGGARTGGAVGALPGGASVDAAPGARSAGDAAPGAGVGAGGGAVPEVMVAMAAEVAGGAAPDSPGSRPAASHGGGSAHGSPRSSVLGALAQPIKLGSPTGGRAGAMDTLALELIKRKASKVPPPITRAATTLAEGADGHPEAAAGDAGDGGKLSTDGMGVPSSLMKSGSYTAGAPTPAKRGSRKPLVRQSTHDRIEQLLQIARNTASTGDDGGGGEAGGARDGSARAGAGPVWHSVHVCTAAHPLTGAPVLVVTQHDVTRQMDARTQLSKLLEYEHKILESIFPRHVIEYLTLHHTTGDSQRGSARLPPPHSARAATARSRLAGTAAAAGAGGQAPNASALMALQQSSLANVATAHPCVTILFADIVGFTQMCKQVSPLEVMTFLNALYQRFDAMIDIYKVYKVETIGDCFMVAGGLVGHDEEGWRTTITHDRLHAVRVMAFAKAMVREARKVQLPTGGPVMMRVGMHSGPVMSGVVGSKMPRFCLFGDTVNTASRMESTSQPGRIHVSADTHDLLPNERWEPTGGVMVKGKGMMATYMSASDSFEEKGEQLQRVLGVYL